MSKITLRQAARWCGGTVEEKYADIEFFGANNDTRIIRPGQLFIVLQGVKPEHGEYIVVEDRRAAIRYAMDIAKKDDIIVLAGKGHETYQEICGVKHHLDEREVVAAYL